MRTFLRLFSLLLLVAIVGGGIFLATWDIPPPTETVEIPISDDRLPR